MTSREEWYEGILSDPKAVLKALTKLSGSVAWGRICSLEALGPRSLSVFLKLGSS